ncbi:uncharacterized protein LOC108163278 isoform X4 [Drosophila miranda]|uniref:uncharacterized protein LOC108163278 isoform X4 n=1 Tax=Drosophila miranda TaxID=7229 RepID=UPI00143F65D4|nr:uncharacterized protein LOC108163278 isoform X4 [Drosophila miranda]
MRRSPLVPPQVDTSGGQECLLPADTDMPIIVYHGISTPILKSGSSATSGTYTAESNVGLRDAPMYPTLCHKPSRMRFLSKYPSQKYSYPSRTEAEGQETGDSRKPLASSAHNRPSSSFDLVIDNKDFHYGNQARGYAVTIL